MPSSSSMPPPPPIKRYRRTSSSPGRRQPHQQRSNADIDTDNNNKNDDESDGPSLPTLCLSRSWTRAADRAHSHPWEAAWGSTIASPSSLSSSSSPSRGLLSNNVGRRSATSGRSPSARPAGRPAGSAGTGSTDNSQIRSPARSTGPILSSSALAVACRYSAPYSTIKSILDADPGMVRRSIPSRGTPLHEAVAGGEWDWRGAGRSGGNGERPDGKDFDDGDDGGIQGGSGTEFGKVIRALLEADEGLDEQAKTTAAASSAAASDDGAAVSASASTAAAAAGTAGKSHSKDAALGAAAAAAAVAEVPTTRAALIRDVDGSTPLHLLVRRCFSSPDAILAGCGGGGGGGCGAATTTTTTFGEKPTAGSSTGGSSSSGSGGGGGSSGNNGLITAMSDLIRSSPSAVGVPDHREFEETPLVMTLKANLYAAGLGRDGGDGDVDDETDMDVDNDMDYDSDADVSGMPSETDPSALADTTSSSALADHPMSEAEAHYRRREQKRRSRIESYHAVLEWRICSAVRMMLRHYPRAAAQVAGSGYGSTALHSAVFHGRCSDTIRLVLWAAGRVAGGLSSREEDLKGKEEGGQQQHVVVESSATVPSALRSNSLGETALHFAAMRGECTRTIDLIASAAPGALVLRDNTTDLTPIQWLWVRFIDGMLARLGKDFSELPEWDDEQGGSASVGIKSTVSSSACSADTSRASACVRDLAEHNNGAVIEGKREPMNFHMDGSSFDAASNNRHDDPRSSSMVDGEESSQHTPADEFEFDWAYFARTRRVDPPVDFIRMRHIPVDFMSLEGRICRRVAGTLLRLIRRHGSGLEPSFSSHSDQKASGIPKTHREAAISSAQGDGDASRVCPYSRNGSSDGAASLPPTSDVSHAVSPIVIEEQATSLFWTKAVSMLRCASLLHRTPRDEGDSATANGRHAPFLLIHTAASTPGTPFSIVRLAASLHPDQISVKDELGRLPLHHAAMRAWHPREVYGSPTGDPEKSESPSPMNLDTGFRSRVVLTNSELKLIDAESLRVFKLILSASDSAAASVADEQGRLPLHYAIETAVRLSQAILETPEEGGNVAHFDTVFQLLDNLIQSYSESLEKEDGVSGLYPFMMPPAFASQATSLSNKTGQIKKTDDRDEDIDDYVVSVVYHLLRQNPSVVNFESLSD